MPDKEMTQHTLKKDKYVNARGGNSHFLDLYCSQCSQHFALYQKDGAGRLLRMYIDRILAPQEFSHLQSRVFSKNEMPNLRCSKCSNLIGTPMVYEAERRLAFRVIQGSFMKKKSAGVYPPSDQTQSAQNT